MNSVESKGSLDPSKVFNCENWGVLFCSSAIGYFVVLDFVTMGVMKQYRYALSIFKIISFLECKHLPNFADLMAEVA